MQIVKNTTILFDPSKVRLIASIDTSDSDQRLDVYIIQALLRLLKRCLKTSSKNVMYGYKVSGCYGLRIKEADFFAYQKVAERDM